MRAIRSRAIDTAVRRSLLTLFNDKDADLGGKLAGIFAVLVAANVAAWIWALVAFRDYPVLVGTAFLAYAFGLRHAVDADHIAAIDNVTRKLMQEGKRPIGTGLFFSLGHSTVVVLASVAIALTTSALQGRFDDLKLIGGTVGTAVSALFLFLVAAANLVILISVYRTFQEVRRGGAFVAGLRCLAVPLRRLEPIAVDAGADLVQISKMLLRADISFFRQRAIDRQSDREIAARFRRVCIRQRIGKSRLSCRRRQQHRDQHCAYLQFRTV